MAEAVSSTNADSLDKLVEQQILEHAQKNFSMLADEIAVSEIKLDDLPSETRQFYVEKKNTSGNIRYNYLYRNSNLYCSGISEDFGRFLRDYNFLSEKNLDASKFMTLLRKLTNLRDMTTIGEEQIKNPTDKLKPYLSQIAAPQLSFTQDNGAKMVFFTKTLTTTPVFKFDVTVSPNYQVTFNKALVKLN